ADFGAHYWTSHEPWVVPEPMTLEPTESYSKEELDEYIAILEEIAREAYEESETVRNAPHRSTIGKIPDHSYFEDPKRWTITWRAYRRKYRGYFEPREAAE
ncbi:TPA: glycine dehydrogenase subunit 2, partial [Candidatus Acetothermia bacterium]|nr:glycine dehydrogenase subunit 2 [Candidatus Acetothermia bacterium]